MSEGETGMLIAQQKLREKGRTGGTSGSDEYQVFFENNPTPMWIYDTETLAFLQVNKAAIQSYGYSRDEFLGMTIKDIRPAEHVPALLQSVEEQRNQPAWSAGIWCHRKKDGTLIEVEIISSPLVVAGKNLRLVQALDVTEHRRTEEALRESEARYRAVVECLPYGMAVSIGDKLVYVNPAAVKLAGVNAEELIGRDVLGFVHQDFRTIVRQRRAQMVRTGVPSVAMEGKLLSPCGRTIEAEWMGVPIVYDGKPAILNAFRDITEYKARGNAIQSILKATAGAGEEFFRGLVAELARALDVSYAFVGSLLPGSPERIRTLAVWADGTIVPNFEYDLDGTPCSHVVGKRLCHFPTDVQRRFPRDLMLVKLGVTSYLGMPLFSTSGKPLGLLSVMDKRPLPNSDLAESLMKIFAERVASELERQKAEEALRQNEARYRTLFESAQDAIYLMEGDRIVDCNPSALQMFGYPREVIVGEAIRRVPIRYVSPRWQPDGSNSVYKAREKIAQALAGAPQFFEWRARRLDGTEFDVEVSLNKFEVGKGPMVLAIVRDITERKWSQGLLAAEKRILEGIARRTPLSDILNEICRSIEGLHPGIMSSFLLLDPDGTRLWPAASPTLPKCWTEAITPMPIGPSVGSCGSAAFSRQQVVVPDIRSDPRWTAYPDFLALALKCGLRACWSTPVFSGDAQLLGTFAMYHSEIRQPSPKDLDLIKQVTHLASIAIEHDRAIAGLRRAHDELEQRVQERTAELKRANERLEELDRLKSQFLASMSHELRTPLNSIIGFTGILQQGFAGPVNEEQKKQLGLVFGSSRHLLSLINDLLDLSRIEAGKVELDHEPFNFIDVVVDVIENLKPLANQKNLPLLSDLPGNRIEMVGDRKRCFQILLNLVNNAVKFTERGQIKVVARSGEGQLRVWVEDTGIGIKPDQMGMLFEAFRQLDGSAKRVYEGTGLGLHLCHRLVDLMKGEIRAESTFGKGSRFTFILPLQLPDVASEKVESLS